MSNDNMSMLPPEDGSLPTPDEWATQMSQALSVTDLRRFHTENYSVHLAPDLDAWRAVLETVSQMVFHGLEQEGIDKESEQASELVPTMLMSTAFMLGRTFQEIETVRLAGEGRLNHLAHHCGNPDHNHG